MSVCEGYWKQVLEKLKEVFSQANNTKDKESRKYYWKECFYKRNAMLVF